MDENGYSDENEAEVQLQRTKSDALAELRRKEHGHKYEMTKVDYTSHLRKTEKPEGVLREKKRSSDSPNYLQHLRKTDTGIPTQPEYVRLAKSAETEGKHGEKRFTAEDLINMAFQKAADADQRDPVQRRQVASKSSGTPKVTGVVGTFEGIKAASDAKEDYRAALKQHVPIERKPVMKKPEDKPTWANVNPKRVLDADIRSKSKDVKHEKPEWAQLGRNSKKTVLGLEHTRTTEKSQAPDWADLANKTDRKRLINLEAKRSTNAESQPEWAGKAREPRDVLRVEIKASKKSGSEESPDYKGVLRRGSRKESITFGELQKALGEEDNNPSGWKLVDRLMLLGNQDQSKSNDLNTINEDFFDENANEVNKRPHQNGHSEQNGVSSDDVFEDKPVRRKSSSFFQQGRRKSSVAKFSLAMALPAPLRREVGTLLMDWVQEIMKDYEDCLVKDLTTSWDNGQAFCNIMHYYEDDKVPVNKLNISSKRTNLMIAFQVASDAGISLPITVDDFMKSKVPDAHKVFDVLYEIYSHYHGPLVEWGVLR